MKIKTMLKKDRLKRKIRIRSKISGSESRPRISVFRSNRYIVAQAINDVKMITIAFSTEVELKPELKKDKQTKIERAKLVGKNLAEKLTKLGIKTAVFDRSGYRYQGRVEALAQGIRVGGIQI